MNAENITSPKRYYWLKLQKTYFNQLEQKKMRRQENGKDMQIIYLRMMLLCLDKGGFIYYQGVYDTLEEELAVEFNEPVELIRQTINFLLSNNMASLDENANCFLPEVAKCTGSEAYSTERSRRCRENKKRCIETDTQQDTTDMQQDATGTQQDATDCNGEEGVNTNNSTQKRCIATDMQQDATHGNEEKELEIEKDIDNKNTNSALTNAPSSSPTRAEINEFFESLWKLYPNKRGKGKVSLTTKKELYRIGYDELTRAIERYKAELKKLSWKNPQNGSTFFHSGYIDYLDKNYNGEEQTDPSNTDSESEQWQRNYEENQEYLKKMLGNTHREPTPDDPFQ